MSTDLVHVATADEIATLPAQDRAVMVTNALHESKQWLAVATKGTDPTPIVEFKAWAATVAEMTKQKRLAGEIQADALEMLRRAERGIGQAVRNGQEAGTISTPGGLGPVHTPGVRGSSPRSNQDRGDSPPSPKGFVGSGQVGHEVYSMTDGVTDEDFEDAITEAREEGNLSRANVVRKIKRQDSKRTRTQLADEIAERAQRGETSAQIARTVGVTEEWVRQTARDFDVDIPADKVLSRTRRIDSVRVIRETVAALEGLAGADVLISNEALSAISVNEANEWTASLTQSIRALNRLNKRIKEAVL